MMLQGYREIVGHDEVPRARAASPDRLRGRQHLDCASSSTSRKEDSGFTGAQLARLDDYFQQWLYGETKPTITPDNF